MHSESDGGKPATTASLYDSPRTSQEIMVGASRKP